MNDWQPIETAPRDGTPILGYNPHLPQKARVGIVYWPDDSWRIADHWAGGALSMTMSKPTHWMPLPAPPV